MLRALTGETGRIALDTRAIAGGGAGASTASLVAILRAATGQTFSSDEIALATLSVEAANVLLESATARQKEVGYSGYKAWIASVTPPDME